MLTVIEPDTDMPDISDSAVGRKCATRFGDDVDRYLEGFENHN